MDGSQITNIIFFFILVLLSAYFSSSETAFTSVSQIRLRNQSEGGDRKASLALKLQENFESLLSTILIGNNLVNIASSAIATVFFVELYPNYGPTVATIVTTLVLLLFGEITPKLLAKIVPDRIAKWSAPILRLLMVIFTPFVWFFGQWQKLVRRLLPFESSEAISEEELLSLVDEAKTGGSIESEEHRLVKAAIEFDDVDISTILTPRVDVVGFDIEESDDVIEGKFQRHPYSRLIVYDESVDNVVGTLHAKDYYRFLKAKSNNQLKYASIENLLTEVLFVPPVMSLSDLLKVMQREQNHIAVVVDEYGGMIGIATMEDALEELVGEIWDETDIIKQELKVLEEGQRYLIRGTYALDKLFDLFDMPQESEWISNTVSGFVIEQLERVPQTNDTFVYKDLLFTITDAQRRRVNEVIVEKIDHVEEEDSNEDSEKES